MNDSKRRPQRSLHGSLKSIFNRKLHGWITSTSFPFRDYHTETGSAFPYSNVWCVSFCQSDRQNDVNSGRLVLLKKKKNAWSFRCQHTFATSLRFFSAWSDSMPDYYAYIMTCLFSTSEHSPERMTGWMCARYEPEPFADTISLYPAVLNLNCAAQTVKAGLLCYTSQYKKALTGGYKYVYV